MHPHPAAFAAARALNAGCRCLRLDAAALRRAVESRLRTMGVPGDLAASHPHLFSRTPVFLPAADARRMAEAIKAVEAAVALPAFRDAALRLAPDIARHDTGTRGAFLGFDFHISEAGPKLIEINTNAGGGLLAALLYEAAIACCGSTVAKDCDAGRFEQRAIEMLDAEWRSTGRAGRPQAIAIVDDAPRRQYLYPEFVLMQGALQRAGRNAVIAAPDELELRDGELRAGDLRIDLVYNRLTDFALEDAAHRTLREAYLGGAAVVTPNPRAHALYADKRALALLGSPAWLRSAGLEPAFAELLGEVIPATVGIGAADALGLWERRRRLFFKPFAGHGSRGAYRGDKLTRRVFGQVVEGGYVAQDLVPPAERVAGEGGPPLKFDVRNFAYAGSVQLLAARLWRGQTTNFRSEGGGFAPVLMLP
jgi:glutathione synthase/RimK-type ligase-like ATP-grasp enzyme